MHKVCPKFIAFKGPLRLGHPAREVGEAARPPLYYAAALLGLGATCVVRLNEADTYDAGEFVRAGLRHQVGLARGGWSEATCNFRL
jgi:hypothetical protein